MPDFLLPDLGEGLTEAEIVAWLIEVGDEVSIDQPVVEVETAKAVVEVPVPFAGRVMAVFGRPGESLAVGSPLITVADNAIDVEAGALRRESAEAPASYEVDMVTKDALLGEPATEQASGNVLIGYGTGAPAPRRRRPRPTERALSGSVEIVPVVATSAAGTAHEPPNNRTVISPLVRKLARSAGIDLGTLAATGTAGTVRRSDVEKAIAARSASTHSIAADGTAADIVAAGGVAAGGVAAGGVADDGVRPDGVMHEHVVVHEHVGDEKLETPKLAVAETRRIPITGVRRLIADKMSASRREIPEATVWVDVDATDLLAARAVMNARKPAEPVSVLALFARFAIVGLRRFPELNAHIEGDEIVIPTAVHLGLAAQTERGLMVPVIREAQNLSARELTRAIADKTSAARAGKLSPKYLSGGTFTVNNYGIFGVDGSAAIINHPEVAILGLGRIIDRPWIVNGQVVARKIAQLSLAFDHRVCDGGVAGGFLRFVADCVEAPVGVLGDL
ncbi:MAG: dihydrolipoamide acetyltransferase family protein [Nakamurella sp.]